MKSNTYEMCNVESKQFERQILFYGNLPSKNCF